MSDVPSIAVFCKVYCVLPSFIFNYFFSSLVTIPMAPVITGAWKNFTFHVRWISTLKFLYSSSFSSSFCTAFLPHAIAISINRKDSFFILKITMTSLFAKPDCTPRLQSDAIIIIIIIYQSHFMLLWWCIIYWYPSQNISMNYVHLYKSVLFSFCFWWHYCNTLLLIFLVFVINLTFMISVMLFVTWCDYFLIPLFYVFSFVCCYLTYLFHFPVLSM